MNLLFLTLWLSHQTQSRFYYWECVVMSRKVIFAFISVVLRPIGVDIQTYTGLGVIAVAMMLQLKFAPYEEPEINRLELLGLVVSYGTLFCGLYLFSPNTSPWFRTVCSVGIVVLNVGFTGYVVYKLRGVLGEARKMVTDRLRKHLSSWESPVPKLGNETDVSTEVEMTAVPVMHTSAMFKRSAPPSQERAEETGDQLPAGWQHAATEDGKPYFYNKETGVSSWTKPEAQFSTGASPSNKEARLSQL